MTAVRMAAERKANRAVLFEVFVFHALALAAMLLSLGAS